MPFQQFGHQLCSFWRGNHNHLRLFQYAICSLNWEIYAKDHLTWLTYVWPLTNPLLRTRVCGLFKIPGFSGRWYFNRLVLLPFFGTRLRHQSFNLAPTQYRQLHTLLGTYLSIFPVGVGRSIIIIIVVFRSVLSCCTCFFNDLKMLHLTVSTATTHRDGGWGQSHKYMEVQRTSLGLRSLI